MTDDWSQIQSDLEAHGIALFREALTPEVVEELNTQLATQAHLEQQQGTAFLEDGNLGQQGDGPNQRVFGLIRKGEAFRQLAKDPRVLGVIRTLFGSSYNLPSTMIEQAELDDVLLSSLTANIVRKGGVEMMKHADQAFVPPTTPYASVVNVIWLLNDFTEENGATLVAPGSHLASNPHQFFMDPPQMVSLEAPAGTAVFLDGRTWHCTGINKTANERSAIFAYYCRPFVRQQENFALSLSPGERLMLDEELLALLGFKVWFTLGSTGGDANGTFVHQELSNKN